MNKESQQKITVLAKSLVENFQTVVKKLGWRLAAGLLSAMASAIFFGWLASEVFEGETKAFDDAVRNAIHQTATPILTGTMIFFTYLGSVWGIISLLVLASAAMIYQGHKRATIILWITMAGQVVLGITLKNSFQRPRPDAFFDFPLPSSYSFPSGHAFASLCFFGIAAWLIGTRTKSEFWKISAWVVAIFLILTIGVSRIYLGVHYPSDVVAGYAAGLIWLVTVIFGDWWWRRSKV